MSKSDKDTWIKVMGRGRTLAIEEIGDNRTPAVTVGFELLEPVAGLKSMPWNGYLTSAAEERTIESLQAMGWSGNDISECEQLMDEGKLSKIVELVIADDTYNGKTRKKIIFVNAVGGRGKKLSGDALEDVKRRVAMRIGEVKRPGTPPSNGTPPPSQSSGGRNNAPPIDDGDIPF